MKSALILPTEDCVNSEVIKRALLNYEKVFLKNPEDRDIVNGNDVMSIANNLPGIAFGYAGMTRPLGKEKDYDLKFERILEEFKLAIDEGSLVLMDVPGYLYLNHHTILYNVPMEDRATYINYRYMIGDESFINAASRGINRGWLGANSFDELAPSGLDDSTNFENNVLNNKVSYLGRVQSEEERIALTKMVHARLGSISRNLVLCDMQGLVPFTDNIGYSAVIHQMQSNFSNLVTEASDGSLELDRLDLTGKVEGIMFSDYLDQSKINALSVKEVLTLRTRMWGAYSANKIKMEESLLKIALISKDINDFNRKVSEQFDKFLKENRDYVHERGSLGIKLACNVGALASSYPISSVMESFTNASSFGLLMALACPAAFILLEKRVPEVCKILKQQKELTRLPAYDLFNYFKPLMRA
jgi:hypothetical protein